MFYRSRLLAPDGRPISRLDRPWPADIHAAAEAILVLTQVRPGRDSVEQALQVLEWTSTHLGRADGAYGYLRHPAGTDWTPHLRWGQAWMLWGLASLENAVKRAWQSDPVALE